MKKVTRKGLYGQIRRRQYFVNVNGKNIRMTEYGRLVMALVAKEGIVGEARIYNFLSLMGRGSGKNNTIKGLHNYGIIECVGNSCVMTGYGYKIWNEMCYKYYDEELTFAQVDFVLRGSLDEDEFKRLFLVSSVLSFNGFSWTVPLKHLEFAMWLKNERHLSNYTIWNVVRIVERYEKTKQVRNRNERYALNLWNKFKQTKTL